MPQSAPPPVATRGRDAVTFIVTVATASYVLWVLAGTVAWISHLGHRAAWLQRFLLAKGFPSNAPTKNLATFFIGNVPTALGFVLPHSLLPPKKLYALMHSWGKSELVHSIPIAGPVVTHFLRLPGSGRLVYNAIAAGTLHFLLFHFAPLATPVVAVLPFPKLTHVCLSVGFLAFAMLSMVFEPETYGLLGVGQILKWSPRYATPPPNNMDAITWMGVNSWRGGVKVGGLLFKNKPGLAKAFGGACFVLFTGVSILPATLTFGDCLTRGVAAFYLRRRSKSFRKWVASVEGAHLMTWAIRGCLLMAAFRAATKVNVEDLENMKTALKESSSSLSPLNAMACAGGTALVLRLAENHGASGDAKRDNKKKQKTDEKNEDDENSELPVVEVSFASDAGVKPGEETKLPPVRRVGRLSSEIISC